MKKWHKIFTNGSLEIHSPEAMRELGMHLGTLLEQGEIIGIAGNLGAGKTHLSQGIMEGVGSKTTAASPTFSLVHEHRDGRIPVCHFDFYRMKSAAELESIGWEDYLDRGDALIIEWADMFPECLPESADWILIEHTGEHDRRVSLKTLHND